MKKNLLIILMLFSSLAYSQRRNQLYTSFQFDANMAFGVKNNANTLIEDRGLDWDIEIGFVDKNLAVYLFYGRFNELKYQNYGLGFDYYIKLLSNIESSFGLYYSQILRKDNNNNWGSFTAWVSPRGQIVIPILPNINANLIAKYQQRPELNKYIFEGVIGLTFKINR